MYYINNEKRKVDHFYGMLVSAARAHSVPLPVISKALDTENKITIGKDEYRIEREHSVRTQETQQPR